MSTQIGQYCENNSKCMSGCCFSYSCEDNTFCQSKSNKHWWWYACWACLAILIALVLIIIVASMTK